MSEDARFDPRFDPAFQPGYDGPIAPPRTPKAPTVVSEVRAPHPVAPPVEHAAHSVLAAPVLDEDDEPSTRRNPFVVALLVIAAVLIVGGLWLVTVARDLQLEAMNSTNSTYDYITPQVIMFGAPTVICLGIATAIGVLFLLAARTDRP